MEKIYPIDIAGIINIGVEEWLKRYYIPVTGKEYQTIYDNVFTSFLDTVKQYNDDVVYWTAISNIKVIRFTSQWILEVLRLIRLKEGGYEYIIGKEKIRIPNDISIYEYNSLAKTNLIGTVVSEQNYQEKIKNVLKTIRYNFPSPVFTNKYFLTNISSPVFYIGKRSRQEVVAYCNQNKISPIHLTPMLFANNCHEEVNKDSGLKEILEFVNSFFVLLKKQFPAINSSLFELLRKELDGWFIYSLLFFRQNVNVFRKFKPKKLLATGLGKPVHRLFCASWRYVGGEVIGFNHGNSYYYDGYSPGIITFLPLVNQYVTVTVGHKEILQKAMEEFPCGLKMGNITVLKKSYYKQLYTELQRKKPINKIKKIMLVGFPMTDCYYPFFPSAYAFAQLELEIRLVTILRSKGYYVLYKPHPVTLNEVEGLFDGYADEVIKPRFEEVFDKADCIMYGSFTTTTFGFSLHTNKPIVLIEVKGNYWHPRAFELIKKRCSVVEAEAVDGKIVFDEKDVLNAIENSLENINYEILHEFAF
jgi:hypothetical protein